MTRIMSCPGVAMRTNDATTNNHQVASIIGNFPAAMRRSVRFAGRFWRPDVGSATGPSGMALRGAGRSLGSLLWRRVAGLILSALRLTSPAPSVAGLGRQRQLPPVAQKTAIGEKRTLPALLLGVDIIALMPSALLHFRVRPQPAFPPGPAFCPIAASVNRVGTSAVC